MGCGSGHVSTTSGSRAVAGQCLCTYAGCTQTCTAATKALPACLRRRLGRPGCRARPRHPHHRQRAHHFRRLGGARHRAEGRQRPARRVAGQGAPGVQWSSAGGTHAAGGACSLCRCQRRVPWGWGPNPGRGMAACAVAQASCSALPCPRWAYPHAQPHAPPSLPGNPARR